MAGADIRRTAGPLWRSVQLTVLVAAGATALGVGLAWLTVRTDLPGRKVWRVTAVLPLVIPSFVGAAAWRLTFERRGLLDDWFGITSLPEMRGLRGATIVLSCSPTRTCTCRLRPASPASPRRWRRTPASSAAHRATRSGASCSRSAASAIAAGTLFVALYTVSEFGSVQILGYDTLTRRLFANQLRQQDVATAMGLLLAVLALAITIGERAVVRRIPPVGRDRRPPSAARAARRWRSRARRPWSP